MKGIKNLSISKRISLYLIIGILVYILINSIVVYIFSKQIIDDYTSGYIESRQEQVNSAVSQLIEDIIINVVRLTTYDPLYGILADKHIDYLKKEEEIKVCIESLNLDTNKIAQIEIVDREQNTYTYSWVEAKIDSLPSTFLQQVQGSKLGVWSEVVKDSSGQAYLGYGVPLYNYYTMQKGGHVIVWIKEEAIRKTYRSKFEDMGSIFIVNENDIILSHENEALIGHAALFIGADSDKKEFSYAMSGKGKEKVILSKIENKTLSRNLGLHMYVVTSLNYEQIFSIIKQVNKGLAILSIVIALGIIIGIFFMCNKLSARLHVLAKKIKVLGEGNMDDVIYDTTQNEVNILEENFNKMVEEIRLLIEKNNYEKEQQRKMELVALQAQINPHFLYNTLDTISWMAKIQKQPEIEEMVIQLAKFFRLSLNSGKKYVTIEQEINIVKSFVTIEQVRAPKRFTMHYEIEEGVETYRIVKLILQPIVENAIKHGMNRRRKDGNIYLKIKRIENKIFFFIEDDGVGFDINAKRPPDDKGGLKPSGYGIKNVRERLELEYGSSAGIDIESKPGMGTRVSVYVGIEELCFSINK
ncbi:sensor histidine kinase [Niameybacter massiliensis]|uniref:Sensor histidine kinase n=1 Tax=Holtiella tumoricola TaxID=3018743 RepID=A0AA42DPE7_9FIRM|nr:sensor histidine kinase [Holtiella tumoricola]MDA3732341.1 sensor histidine kinase [Holtiella tumoricola]